MIYLIVDPHFLYIPPRDELTKEQAISWIKRVNTWNKVIQKFKPDELQVRLSKQCRNALKSTARSALDEKWFADTVGKHVHVKYEDFIRVCSPLIQRLMGPPFVDEDSVDELRRRSDGNMEWEIEVLNTMISPPQYMNRFDNEALKACFLQMLADVVFARNNPLHPLSRFENLYLLTALEETAENWAEGNTIFVRIMFQLALENNVAGAKSLEKEKMIVDTFPVLNTPDLLQTDREASHSKRRYSRVVDAVDAVVERYADVFVYPKSARQTAKNSSYENPDRIFRLIEGLVLHWLHEYALHEDEQKAWDAWYERHRQEYVNTEGIQKQNDPRLRREYTVLFEGEEVFCGKHIKVGNGSSAVRINFEVVKARDGNYRILLARAGKHGKNAKI